MGTELKEARALRTTLSLKELVQEANEHHNLAVKSAKGALIHAVDSGQRLLAIKGKCQHGGFEKLVLEEGDMPLRTAQRYMMIAKKYDDYIEKYGPGQMATISIAEGIRQIEGKHDEYYPPDEPDQKRQLDQNRQALRFSPSNQGGEPVDGTEVCPRGGEHDYDAEECCTKCHDQRDAPAPDQAARATARASALADEPDYLRDQRLDHQRRAETLFASTESLFHKLMQTLDQLHNASPYHDKAGMQDALDIIYQSFRKWRYKK